MHYSHFKNKTINIHSGRWVKGLTPARSAKRQKFLLINYYYNMRIQDLLQESIELKPGNILDLTGNYPQYSRLLARVENIRSSGKVDLLIVKAVSTKNNPPFVEGQTITVAPNYIKRAPIVAESSYGETFGQASKEKTELMRKHNIKPGTEEWFKLWFSLPYMTGEKPH